MITTEILQNKLGHCIGKSTVEVAQVDNILIVYHYQAPILYYDIDNQFIVLNYYFYDYSSSTSRVRNTALYELTFFNHNLSKSYLNRHENKSYKEQLKKFDNEFVIAKITHIRGKLKQKSQVEKVKKIIKECMNNE